MVDKNTYYVMVVPTSKASVKFRPCVLEYDLDFEKAKAVMRDYIRKTACMSDSKVRSFRLVFSFIALRKLYLKTTSLRTQFWGWQYDKDYARAED